jgi:hypothetical protein
MLAGLVSVVCWITILIKLFQREGTGKGIFGLICGAYTFYWGWKNATFFDMQAAETGVKQALPVRTVMMIWTGAWIASVIVSRMM